MTMAPPEDKKDLWIKEVIDHVAETKDPESPEGKYSRGEMECIDILYAIEQSLGEGYLLGSGVRRIVSFVRGEKDRKEIVKSIHELGMFLGRLPQEDKTLTNGRTLEEDFPKRTGQ